jgi:hypothetical protein
VIVIFANALSTQLTLLRPTYALVYLRIVLFLMANFNFVNYVKEATRSAWYKFNSSTPEPTFQTNTLIDVVLHNSDMVSSTHVISCPFSDHKLVLTNVNIYRPLDGPENACHVFRRNLSKKNFKKIDDTLNQTDFSVLNQFDSVNSK